MAKYTYNFNLDTIGNAGARRAFELEQKEKKTAIADASSVNYTETLFDRVRRQQRQKEAKEAKEAKEVEEARRAALTQDERDKEDADKKEKKKQEEEDKALKMAEIDAANAKKKAEDDAAAAKKKAADDERDARYKALDEEKERAVTALLMRNAKTDEFEAKFGSNDEIDTKRYNEFLEQLDTDTKERFKRVYKLKTAFAEDKYDQNKKYYYIVWKIGENMISRTIPEYGCDKFPMLTKAEVSRDSRDRYILYKSTIAYNDYALFDCTLNAFLQLNKSLKPEYDILTHGLLLFEYNCDWAVNLFYEKLKETPITYENFKKNFKLANDMISYQEAIQGGEYYYIKCSVRNCGFVFDTSTLVGGLSNYPTLLAGTAGAVKGRGRDEIDEYHLKDKKTNEIIYRWNDNGHDIYNNWKMGRFYYEGSYYYENSNMGAIVIFEKNNENNNRGIALGLRQAVSSVIGTGTGTGGKKSRKRKNRRTRAKKSKRRKTRRRTR